MALETVIVAAASRPYPGEIDNGDAWYVDWYAGRCRVAVIDGLGHGAAAADAAHMALRTLAAHPDLLPEDSLRACHAALASTRGAAISVATIDPEHRQLTFCGVGNAEASLLAEGQREHLIAYRGIVGRTFPRLRTFSYPLETEWLLVMHTDGLASRFAVEGPRLGSHPSPQALADDILQTWARPTDDATIVVVCAGQDWPASVPSGAVLHSPQA